MDDGTTRPHAVTNPYELPALPAAAARFARALERNRERLGSARGLSPTELRAFFQIAQRGHATPTEIADHLGVTTAAMVTIARALSDLGLVQRRSHPTDGRSVLLELTDLGHDEMWDMHQQFDGVLDAAAQSLSDRERDAFVRALDAAATYINHNAGSPGERIA